MRVPCDQGGLGRVLIGIVVVVASLFGARGALAEVGANADRVWIPSVALYMAGLLEDRKASADSEVSAFQDGDSISFPWSIGAEAALASPVLGSSKLKPRLIVHAGGGYVLDGLEPVTTVGDPGNRPTISPRQPNAVSIENQGSGVQGQAKPWVLTGGFGTQIEFDVFERRVYLRPSLEWMYRKDTVHALLGAAEDEILDINGNCGPCRILSIDAETEKAYHSLGAGIEASIDSGRLGGFLVRFFASGQVYHILGDRKTEFSPVGTWVRTDGAPSTRADPVTEINVRYERDPLHYRFGMGLQFHWQP